MRKYEMMYIIRPDVEAEERKALIEEINAIFTSRGTEQVQVNEWGMKEFAYEIEDLKKGYYVVLTCLATSEAIDEFERVLNIKETVLRHIVVKREK